MLCAETNYSAVIQAQHSKRWGQIKSSDGAIFRTKNIYNSRGLEDYNSYRGKVGQKSFFSPERAANITKNYKKLLTCEYRNKE